MTVIIAVTSALLVGSKSFNKAVSFSLRSSGFSIRPGRHERGLEHTEGTPHGQASLNEFKHDGVSGLAHLHTSVSDAFSVNGSVKFHFPEWARIREAA